MCTNIREQLLWFFSIFDSWFLLRLLNDVTLRDQSLIESPGDIILLQCTQAIAQCDLYTLHAPLLDSASKPSASSTAVSSFVMSEMSLKAKAFALFVLLSFLL